MSFIESGSLLDPEHRAPDYAEFGLGPNVELPNSVVEYLESHNVPHLIYRTDEEDCLRMLTNTGMYDGEQTILAILNTDFPENTIQIS